jgi:hypothetical protein
MISADILSATGPVVDVLDALGVPYLVGGSVASSAYGMARSTLDVDLVADLEQKHVTSLVRRLEGNYYIDEEMIRDAIRRRSCFNLIHLDTMLKVDIFVLKSRDYDQNAFGNRRKDTLDEAPDARVYYLASPEDIILNKLEWYRLGDHVSERQWNDVIGVIKVQQERLDRSYIRRWAGQLGVADLLERALEEARTMSGSKTRST